MIVKHANPCGVALGETIEEAYERALAADPVSAYGGVVVLNRPVSAALGERLAEQFVEVLFAPGYDAVAVEALVRKPNVAHPERHGAPRRRRARARPKRVLGGLLVQDRDREVADRSGMTSSAASRTRRSGATCCSRGASCKHVTSNAIVLAKDLRTIGVGAGQMSRVDAVRIAVEKAREHGHELDGRGARLGRVLPVRGRAATRARRGRRRR